MKNFNILVVYWKIWLLGEGKRGTRKTNIEGGLPKKEGGLEQFADLRGAWQERGGGGVFEGELIPQCTLWKR